MIKYMVYKGVVSKVKILEQHPSYAIVEKGNEILCVPAEDPNVAFFDTEPEACSYCCGGHFVPMDH